MGIPLINGIIQTETGYAVKNFMQPEKPPIDIGTLHFPDYRTAVIYLSNLLYPESYRPYLLAVERITPTEDTWDNLIFIGHTEGMYDHEKKCFRSARSMDMNAASEAELAYAEALKKTWNSIKSMIK